MSDHLYSLRSTYSPLDGTGTVRINFSDLRRSTRKNAEAGLNKHLPSLQKDRPAGTVITASLLEGTRFDSSWTFALSTATKPAKPAHPASRSRK